MTGTFQEHLFCLEPKKLALIKKIEIGRITILNASILVFSMASQYFINTSKENIAPYLLIRVLKRTDHEEVS